MEDLEQKEKRFVEILSGVDREGMLWVIEGLGLNGFFKAPASARHHLAEPGGLLQHSLNVYDQAVALREAQVRLRPELAERVQEESVALAALLHDVCKADVYKTVQKWRKDSNGKWESYTAYEYDASHFPLGHGEKSVVMLMQWGLELTDDEIAAIRWHMAGWDLSEYRESRENFSKACEKYPLLPILIAADELATRITEVECKEA